MGAPREAQFDWAGTMSVAVRLDLRPCLGPVRDQGARATCLAHAATAAHEHARGSTLALSPEYLHYFACGGLSSLHGIEFPEISRALKDPGQPAESDCPYHLNDPPSGWSPAKNLRSYHRQSMFSGQAPDEVEALLDAGHAPVLGIATTDAFYAPVPPAVISATGPVRGLHAVVAVGIGTTGTERCFLIRNSWGSMWGDVGHAWVDDAFILQHLYQVMVVTDEVT